MDFRSDTVTKPTQAMRRAMMDAPVGDDVYGDDPSVNKLQERMAELLGKEAALFVPSGTFSNQLAIMTHTQRGDEILVLEDAHIFFHEAGAPGLLSGVNMRQAKSVSSCYDLDELPSLFRDEDIHYPRTSLVCMENAHGSGRVVALDKMAQVYKIAKEKGANVHLDGARIFNAAVHLGVEAKEIAQYADSISVCLSKGLSAPVGSVLLGSKEFIDKALKYRKIMGGGMRQAGVLAVCGLVSLDEVLPRLEEDHILANYLALGLEEIEGIEVAKDRLDLNMVFFTLKDKVDLAQELLKRGILVNPEEEGEYRLVTHIGTSREDVDRLVLALKEILQ
ncbi:MAG: low-specificity L-threonine aldolase [Tissierellia bacterium]|nr:low-specificity L-threonine aldolase [Tissierellia bacterium]